MNNLQRIAATALLLIFGVSDLEAGLKDKWKKRKDQKQDQRAEKILAESYQPSQGWEAYFRDEEGRNLKIRQPIEQNQDKLWIGLTFTDYSGPRLRLGVMPVRNDSPVREATGGQFGDLEVSLSGIEELLSTALFNTRRFDLVERKRLQVVLGEQDFGATGRVSQPTAAKIGHVHGANFLIYGVVNEWTPNKKVSKVGGSRRIPKVPVIGRLGVGSSVAEVAMSFTVTDADTGEVLHQLTERATASNRSITSGIGHRKGGLDASQRRSSPIGYAVQACINKAAYTIAMALKDRPWRGSVASITESSVWINAGGDQGLSPGLTLTVLAKGPDIVDPETGTVIGQQTEAIGSLVVTGVQDKISAATIIQGCEGIKVGDRVEVSGEARPLETMSLGAAPAPLDALEASKVTEVADRP
ncbi:MAG: CsgG/HfaB family protein [Deltaproteobacteria bacterium]|nr:CsgG/HfaB family protein [Deltaproteobacteria bacterium]